MKEQMHAPGSVQYTGIINMTPFQELQQGRYYIQCATDSVSTVHFSHKETVRPSCFQTCLYAHEAI